MKKRLVFFLTLIVAFLALSDSYAQTAFEVPSNYKLDVKEDYEQYEPDIIAASIWLESNDLDKEAGKRKEVSAFIMKWIMGSPSVSVSLTEQLQKLYGKNISLLTIYMAAYSRHFLENKSTATNFSGVKAGLTSMMKVYQKGIEIKKNKEMEKLIKLAEENKIDAYISETFL